MDWCRAANSAWNFSRLFCLFATALPRLGRAAVRRNASGLVKDAPLLRRDKKGVRKASLEASSLLEQQANGLPIFVGLDLHFRHRLLHEKPDAPGRRVPTSRSLILRSIHLVLKVGVGHLKDLDFRLMRS